MFVVQILFEQQTLQAQSMASAESTDVEMKVWGT